MNRLLRLRPRRWWATDPDVPVLEPPIRAGRWNVSWLLPSVLLASLVVADWTAPEHLRIVTWLGLVPALAAATCGVWTTVGFALGTLVTVGWLEYSLDHRYPVGLSDFLLVVTACVLSVLASALRLRAYHLVRQLEDAAQATRLAVLRPIPSRIGGVETANLYLAAERATKVGGDFFDVQPSPYGPRVLLGDVQGKGTSAVDAAAALLSAFREAAYYEADLAVVAERLESRMRRHNRYMALLGERGERFATAVLVGLPARDTGGLEMVNFGHEAPYAVTPERIWALPEGDGAPLGLTELTGALPPVRRVPFPAEATLLLYTDGVSEARNRANQFLPVEEELGRATDTAPRALVGLIEEAVLRHTGGRLTDDTTLLAVRRDPRPPPGGLALD
ncbi:PP2C family protein-serine/threonine phosphatase [Streptomyces sp. DSM 44915]|uniref:PP2C family protein-serine/threonine phosphatase n=1 Tax=Streptomyces chisholmiae TaxID=3075540 RepID=A0ABU2K0Q0_9ACTN|nr:PP2C family protein-serine/threonine phosphatase [Streptomyces sp. DSM 44915]MDT0270797.1 PP2C family protein-serine/threonine phosphatase [Streptomyces sp. DSM 44915]